MFASSSETCKRQVNENSQANSLYIWEPVNYNKIENPPLGAWCSCRSIEEREGTQLQAEELHQNTHQFQSFWSYKINSIVL